MKSMKVGIMPHEEFKNYTMAIASGRHVPKKGEPKVWFESVETMSQILSTKNVQLLQLMDMRKPRSIKELAQMSGRASSNLSRTLKTFQRYGIVDLVKKDRTIVPIPRAISFDIEYGKKYFHAR